MSAWMTRTKMAIGTVISRSSITAEFYLIVHPKANMHRRKAIVI